MRPDRGSSDALPCRPRRPVSAPARPPRIETCGLAAVLLVAVLLLAAPAAAPAATSPAAAPGGLTLLDSEAGAVPPPAPLLWPEGSGSPGGPGSRTECGGTLNASRGVIHTPDFPHPFRVPIKCRWVINATGHHRPKIIVYLTQVYVVSGLSITSRAAEIEMSGVTDITVPIWSVTRSNVTTSSWASSKYPYVVVDFNLDVLEGNHLRVLSHLQDVFGFNLTYEVIELPDGVDDKNNTYGLRDPKCNHDECSFVGDCYVSHDYQNFSCACLPGYLGHNCGIGPTCHNNPGICRNNGTCRSMGTEYFGCYCEGDYTGTFCEVPPLEQEGRECDSSGDAVCNCSGGPPVQTDRARFTVELRLLGLPSPSDPDFHVNLNLTFARAMSSYLERSNVSLVTNLEVLELAPNGFVKFHVVSRRSDAEGVKQALNRLLDTCAGCLPGEMRVTGTHYSFTQEPTLHLIELRPGALTGVVREGEDFTLSCVAKGSTSMQFSWYKDGVLINASLTRRLWTQVLQLDSQEQWMAVLVVEGASPLDGGRFSCRVWDWGSEQCRAADVFVVSPPRPSVQPLVHTVPRGANVTTRCTYPGNESLGVTWTRNGALLGLVPGKEVEEDLLYPHGSLLSLYNVQQSATYSCKVVNWAGSTTVHSRVDVVRTGSVPECPAENEWAITPAGREARAECSDLGGVARRQCTLQGDRAAWEPPDFSECLHEDLVIVRDNFTRLKLGYAGTTSNKTLTLLRRWLEERGPASLREREGEPILALAVDVVRYERLVNGAREVLQLREELFNIVNLLLQNPHAVRDLQAVQELQSVLREQALLWASALPSSMSSASSVSSAVLSESTRPMPSVQDNIYSEMAVHVVGTTDVEHLDRGVGLPKWDSGQVWLHMSKALAQRSVVAAVITFKSLHKLLPERSVAELPDSTELEYELASSLVSVSIGSEAGDLIKEIPNSEDFAADVMLQVNVPGVYSWPKWNMTCAVTDIARGATTPGPLPWSTSPCTTLVGDSFDPDMRHWQLWDPYYLRPGQLKLRCNCTSPGTIAVLLTSNTSESLSPSRMPTPTVLLAGLTLCALQTGATLLVLLPRWLSGCRARCGCTGFLRFQSAASSFSAACLFISGLTRSDSPVPGAGFVAALHGFLLTGLAAHLGKLLLLYTELVGVRPLPYLRHSLIAMIAGAPLVPVAGGLVAARTRGGGGASGGGAGGWYSAGPYAYHGLQPGPSRSATRFLTAAWAPWGSPQCSVLVVTAAVIVVAFLFLLGAVWLRLSEAAREKSAKQRGDLRRRWGLVHRASAILVCQVLVLAASVLYASVSSVIVCYAFSIFAAVLGAVTLAGYVARPEASCWCSRCSGIASGGTSEGTSRGTSGLGADSAQAPSQPLTFAWWRSAVAALLVSRRGRYARYARSYQLVSRPSDTPAPSESLCPFIVFTKHDAESENEGSASNSQGRSAASGANVGRAWTSNGGVATTQMMTASLCTCTHSRPTASCATHLPMHDMRLEQQKQSPNKYLYMRCQSDDGGGGDSALHVRTLYQNDWSRLVPPPASSQRQELLDVPLRPEPVPCYIRGEPGVPLVVSPTRRPPPPPPAPSPPAPPPTYVEVLTCKADVEPEPPSPRSKGRPGEEDEDVLNRISHDLDYLLSGDPSTPAPAPGPAPCSNPAQDAPAGPATSGSGISVGGS